MRRRNGEGQRVDHGVAAGDLVEIGLVDEDLGVGEARSNRRVVGEMVEVTVGQPQAHNIPSALLALIEQRGRGVVRGIEEHRLLRRLIGDQPAVGLSNPPASFQYFHGSHRQYTPRSGDILPPPSKGEIMQRPRTCR